MIERIAMALLDDHFVPRKIAYIRDVAHPRLKVFRHHAGISDDHGRGGAGRHQTGVARDRKSTRLNSSHGYISYAVFCLKKKNRAAMPIRIAGALAIMTHLASSQTRLRTS